MHNNNNNNKMAAAGSSPWQQGQCVPVTPGGDGWTSPTSSSTTSSFDSGIHLIDNGGSCSSGSARPLLSATQSLPLSDGPPCTSSSPTATAAQLAQLLSVAFNFNVGSSNASTAASCASVAGGAQPPRLASTNSWLHTPASQADDDQVIAQIGLLLAASKSRDQQQLQTAAVVAPPPNFSRLYKRTMSSTVPSGLRVTPFQVVADDDVICW